MTLTSTRTALAAAITAGCTGWRCPDFIPDQINPPVILLDFEVGDQLVMGDTGTVPHSYAFKAWAYVQRDSERAGQLLLDQLRDPTDTASLWQVVEGSTVGNYVTVSHASVVQEVTVASGTFLMVEFDMEMVT